MKTDREGNHNHKYDDIINLPCPTSATHPRMSQRDRAAQFSPFAALVGYEDEVKETARLTDEKVELNEEAISQIDRCLQLLVENMSSRPDVSITVFQPDEKKQGGKYRTMNGKFRRFDTSDRTVVLVDGTKIPIEDIFEIEAEWM